jgi:hypothetical protein
MSDRGIVCLVMVGNVQEGHSMEDFGISGRIILKLI